MTTLRRDIKKAIDDFIVAVEDFTYRTLTTISEALSDAAIWIDTIICAIDKKILERLDRMYKDYGVE